VKTFYFLYLIVQLFCINFAHSENQTNWTEVIDLFFVKFDENCVKKENLDICESSKSLIDIKINIEKHKFITIYEHGKVIENIVIFDESNFNFVKEELIKQLGSSQKIVEKLNAGMAGSFNNEIYVWNNNEHIIFFEQFHKKITFSALRVLSPSDYKMIMEKREGKKIRGVRNL